MHGLAWDFTINPTVLIAGAAFGWKVLQKANEIIRQLRHINWLVETVRQHSARISNIEGHLDIK